jgi:hypothetical protein
LSFVVTENIPQINQKQSSPEFSTIPEKLYPSKVFLEDQSLSLTDGQHFYQETKAFLSALQQKCTQYSKCQWQVYTAFQRKQLSQNIFKNAYKKNPGND